MCLVLKYGLKASKYTKLVYTVMRQRKAECFFSACNESNIMPYHRPGHSSFGLNVIDVNVLKYNMNRHYNIWTNKV